jgi:hypothetical protein
VAVFLGIILMMLMVAWPALCQSANQSLPDCPSTHITTQTQPEFARETNQSLLYGAAQRESTLTRMAGIAASDKTQAETNAVRKLFLPRATGQQPGYPSLNDDSLIGRATHAASRAILTRDYSGKDRLNTAYLLRTLASVAADTASKPYWRRSVSDPFSNFGSTVGNDAGTNLWHEFGPGIEHIMKSYAPKFLGRIAEQIEHPQDTSVSKSGSKDARNLAQNAH